MFVFGGHNGLNYGSVNDLVRYNPGNGMLSKVFKCFRCAYNIYVYSNMFIVSN